MIPFRRVNLLVAAFNAAHAAFAVAADDGKEEARKKLDEANGALLGYKSRGKGGAHKMQRTITGRWAQDRSRYSPAECAARGCR